MFLTRVEIINVESHKHVNTAAANTLATTTTVSKTSVNQTKRVDENRWKLYELLFERLCNWKLKFASASEIYSYMLPKLNTTELFNDPNNSKFSSKAIEFLLAYQLLCKFEGWNWLDSKCIYKTIYYQMG